MMPQRGFGLWLTLGVFYALIGAPLVGLCYLAAGGSGLSSGQIWSAGFVLTLTDTALLLAGVGLLSTAIGLGSAWLIAMYTFPGRAILGVMLVLPLALPTYLAAYVAVEIGDFYGPLQRLVRWCTGATTPKDYWFPDVRSLPGAMLIFSLVLYPYIYLPARLMFERQGSTIIQAARLHGSKGWRLFAQIGLPLARPAVAGGAAFVLLETLNDIGAVEHLGVQSISLTIRSIWLNRGNLAGAAQVALVCLALVLVILALEYALRLKKSVALSSRGGAFMSPLRLQGNQARAAFCLCLLPVLIGCLVPAGFLVFEAVRSLHKSGISNSIVPALLNSLLVSVAAAVLVATVGAAVAISARLVSSRWTTLTPQIGTLGYAIPGTVLVIALLPAFYLIDEAFSRIGMPFGISGSAAAVVAVYLVRFSGIGITQAQVGLSRLSHTIDHAARTLGGSTRRVALGVLAPNILRATALGGLLVMVDAMKELPATLLLRPLNFETLATTLYAHASSGSFEEGALEALLLFLVGLLPVMLLAKIR